MTFSEFPEKARVWWNGEHWEAHVPGDRHSYIDSDWEAAMHWADCGMAFRKIGW